MRKFAGGARLAPVVGLMAAVGVAADAQASGFQLKEQSAEGLGNAFAGSTAKAQDLSTIFFNPAGMTNLSGHQTDATVSYIAPRAEFTDEGSGLSYLDSSPMLAPLNALNGAPIQGNPNQGDAVDNALVPALYGMYDLSETLKLGLSVNTPFGLVTDYDDRWVGRYHALKSDLRTIAVQPSIAWKANDWLSIGGGPVFQHAEAELTKAVDTGSVLAGVTGNAALAGNPNFDTKSKVTGSDLAVGYTLGVMLQPLETTRVGLSYRSRITHELDGDVEFSNVPAAVAANPLLAASFANSGGSAKLTLPDTASIGVYHEFSPQFAMMADVAWTNWSLFRELSVYRDNGSLLSSTPEHWEDTWFYSLGATWKPNDKLKLQLGVAYDQSPVPDATRTPRVPDGDRTWLSAGIGYEFMPGVVGNLAYTHIWVDKVNVDLGNEGGGLAEHRLRGSYESSIDIIAAQVKVTF